jgi:hypothetical protein
MVIVYMVYCCHALVIICAFSLSLAYLPCFLVTLVEWSSHAHIPMVI